MPKRIEPDGWVVSDSGYCKSNLEAFGLKSNHPCKCSNKEKEACKGVEINHKLR